MKSLLKVVVLSICLLTAVSFAYAGVGRGGGFGKGVRDGSALINAAGMTMPNYVDQNNDGICDNLGIRTSGAGYGRGRGKGYCAGNSGRGQGKGIKAGRFGKGRGQGKGIKAGRFGKGRGQGKGIKAGRFGRGVRDGSGPINKTGVARPNYVDANGDGICDNSGVRILTK